MVWSRSPCRNLPEILLRLYFRDIVKVPAGNATLNTTVKYVDNPTSSYVENLTVHHTQTSTITTCTRTKLMIMQSKIGAMVSFRLFSKSHEHFQVHFDVP